VKRKVVRRNQKSNGTLAKQRAANGTAQDMVLVPRAFIQNAIQALTTKSEFVRTEAVVALVGELSRIVVPQAGAPPPPPPPPAPDQQPQEPPN